MSAEPEATVKKCPYCLADIPAAARNCRYCSEWVEPRDAATSPEPAEVRATIRPPAHTRRAPEKLPAIDR